MFDKDEQEISQIIEEGIDQLLSGDATLEQILAKHPAEADMIRPELETALWLVTRKEEVGPRPGFVMASRKRVVERVKQEASGQNAKHAIFGFIWPKRLGMQWVAAIVIVVLFLSSTSGLVSASQSALPGDNLYSIKRFSEQVNFNITVDPAGRVQLSEKLANRRLDEISALLTKGKFDAVEPALKEFERQVHRTVALLDNIGAGPAEQNLAAAVQSELTHNAERLEAMQASAPADMTAQLQTAHQITVMGASVAADVSKGNKPGSRFTDTPTLPPTLTASPLPGVTPVPGATDTAAPGVDNLDPATNTGPGTDLAAEPTPDPGNTISPTDTANPNKNSKAPKPKTNPGQGSPANNGNSGNNSNNGNNNGNSGNNGSSNNSSNNNNNNNGNSGNNNGNNNGNNGNTDKNNNGKNK